MKVCFLIERIAQRSGGAERVLADIASGLVERGIDVEIVSHERRVGRPFYALPQAVRVRNIRYATGTPGPGALLAVRLFDGLRISLLKVLPRFFPFDRITHWLRSGGFCTRLERHLEQERPDAAVGFMPPAFVPLALASTTYPLRKLASLHNAPFHDFEDPGRWDPTAFGRRLRLTLLERMDAIGVLLDEHRPYFPPPLQEKICVLPNMVRPVEPEILRGAQRENIVLSVGRLATVKRLDLLLAAWALVRPDFPAWRLHICGTGPLQRSLTRQALHLGLGDSVTFLGHVVDVGARYLTAGVLAHPAAFEGFPMAVSEALAHGVPVVGFSDCPGLNHLVQSGENGVLVSGGEADRVVNFADALRRLLSDAVLRQKLSAAAPASVAQYHPDRIVDAWLEALAIPRAP